MTDNKIEQITADDRTIEVDGVEFTLSPLTNQQFLKAQMKGSEKEADGLFEMMYFTLSQEQDIDRQGLKDAPAKLMQPVQEEMMEMNNFDDFFDEDEKQEALKKQP